MPFLVHFSIHFVHFFLLFHTFLSLSLPFLTLLQLSILAGTLARLDRAAPRYGVGHYNDFNTFYLQAASGTSGGSSGSPVLDIHGSAIAINAGGLKKAASSFYLPLDRVARALRLIQSGSPVTRGTFLCDFLQEPYDEVRRLGLPPTAEQNYRAEFGGTGMLVVHAVLPRGPASASLAPGDILLSVGGRRLVDFHELAEQLDSHVGESLAVTVQRGTHTVSTNVHVADLHAVTPSCFLSLSGAVVHALSYQMARGYNVPTGSVFVASAGYMLSMAGVLRGSIITSVAGKPTRDMEEFKEVVLGLKGGERVPVRSFNLVDVHRERVAIVKIDRQWHPTTWFQRNGMIVMEGEGK